MWILCYIPYVGLSGVQFCDCSCSCKYCDFEFWISCSQHFWRRSCLNSTKYFLSTWGVWRPIAMNKHRLFLLPIGIFWSGFVGGFFFDCVVYASCWPVATSLVGGRNTNLVSCNTFEWCVCESACALQSNLVRTDRYEWKDWVWFGAAMSIYC